MDTPTEHVAGDTRKVQVTGGSTFTVSIPKGWANESDITAGSVVEFHSEADALVLTPRDRRGQDVCTLSLTPADNDELRRVVLGVYLNGFEEVRFDVSQLDSRARRAVTTTARELVGFELVAETRSEVRLRYLLDQSELSVRDTVGQMRQVALEMLTGAVEGLLDGESQRLEAVIERDDDLDRLWFLVSRVFRRVLQDPAAASDDTLDRQTCFDYRSTARQLERVGDHAVKIAENARGIETVPEAIATDLQSLLSSVVTIVSNAVDILETDDTDSAIQRADRLRDRIGDCHDRLRDTERRLWDLDSASARDLRLVLDSLARSADYGGNVAELARQHATPVPE